MSESTINTVICGLEEYDNMSDSVTRHEILVDAIFEEAKLDYTDDGLTFNGELLGIIMKAVEPMKYEATLKRLKRLKILGRKEAKEEKE